MNTMKLAVVAPVEEWKTEPGMIEHLRLAFAWLGNGWRLTEPGEANILLFIMRGDAQSNLLWEKLSRAIPADRILVYGTGTLPEGVQWSLTKTHRGMSMTLNMVNTLLRMQESLTGRSISDEPYHPENYIQGIIKEARADGVGRVLALPEDPEVCLYLLPGEDACYIFEDIEKSVPLCIAQREAIQVTRIPAEELLRKVGYISFYSRLSNYALGPNAGLIQEITARKAKRYTLDELTWFATLVNSGGRLLAGCKHDDSVIVKHWPEITRLSYYQEYLDISKWMSLRGAQLTDIAAQNSLSGRQMVDFHNACALLDLVVRNDQAQRESQKSLAARRQLYNLLKPFASPRGQHIKIVIAGTIGSGKTTAITKLSDFSPLTTETRPSDYVSEQKASTTVAMDYGETRFEDMKLMLYGTPGQKRFEFMGEILCRGAWALLILINNTEANPLAELDYYLNLYRSALGSLRVMVGITHYKEGTGLRLDDYRNHLASQDAYYPVTQLDPREYLDIVRFFNDTLTEASEPKARLRAVGG
ncbi:GTP-binding protein [Methylomagnum sp.]